MTMKALLSWDRIYTLLLFVISVSMPSVFFTGCATYKHTTLQMTPPFSPWEMLADMPGNLGRFKLTNDDRHIYRLGGVSFNIRSGGSYSREFWSFDLLKEEWDQLPSAPFGTGGAFLDYWPKRQSVIAIAGISRLGDAFNTDGVTIGVYNPRERMWLTKEHGCPGLGRVSYFAHSRKGHFLVLAGKNVALLDLNNESMGIVGTYPVSGRTLGVARIKGTLFVLQGESNLPSRLHMFDIRNGDYLGNVDTSEKFVWIDKLFSWRNCLFIWKNSGPYDRNRFTHSSRLLRIEPRTGLCTELHPEYPGPRARRSGNGILYGNSFFTFGGQRQDSVWLRDVYQYHFVLKDNYFRVSPNKSVEDIGANRVESSR